MKIVPTLVSAPLVCLIAVCVLAKDPPKPRTEDDAVTPVGGTDKRQEKFLERATDKDIQLVFLGDSITDFWFARGKTVWDKTYVKYDAANFGVSGEHTEHVLGRIAHGLLDGLHPKVVVIMIGTNNIGHSGTEKPEWAAAGVKKIVETVHAKLPETKVLLLGVFPRDKKDAPLRKKVEEINAIISKLDGGASPTPKEVQDEADRIWTKDSQNKVYSIGGNQVNLAQVQAEWKKRCANLADEMLLKRRKTRYLDLAPKFLDADGNLPKEIFPDGLHPNLKGYEIWAESMQPLLDEMMK